MTRQDGAGTSVGPVAAFRESEETMDGSMLTLITLAGLGAFHGVNPGMGWLFAVALGLQNGHRKTVWASLLPLGAGHALAIVVAVVAVGLAGILVPLSVIKWLVAGALFLFGCYKLVRNRHPRYGGMRVGPKQLTIWSFLMACAHGAGLMVIPLLLGAGASSNQQQSDELAASSTVVAHESSLKVHAHDHERVSYPSTDNRVGANEMRLGGHERHAALAVAIPGGPAGAALAVLFHTMGYLLMTGLAAVVVYERVGLRMLGRAWFNIDVVWTVSLILTAVLTLVV